MDNYVNTWNKLFLDVVEAHAPTKTRRVRGSSVPWMTSTIADQMRRRDYHLKKAKDNKSGRHWRIYRQLRNSVNRDIKKAKSDYYTNLIRESQGNAKEFWKALKKTLPSSKTSRNISSLRVDGAVVTSDESIATSLNFFFVSVRRDSPKTFQMCISLTDLKTTPTFQVLDFLSSQLLKISSSTLSSVFNPIKLLD